MRCRSLNGLRLGLNDATSPGLIRARAGVFRSYEFRRGAKAVHPPECAALAATGRRDEVPSTAARGQPVDKDE